MEIGRSLECHCMSLAAAFTFRSEIYYFVEPNMPDPTSLLNHPYKEADICHFVPIATNPAIRSCFFDIQMSAQLLCCDLR